MRTTMRKLVIDSLTDGLFLTLGTSVAYIVKHLIS